MKFASLETFKERLGGQLSGMFYITVLQGITWTRLGIKNLQSARCIWHPEHLIAGCVPLKSLEILVFLF